jgi:dTDP-glucose 4,6-dehydratase
VNQKEISEILEGHDVVVHFAAESHVDRSIAGSREFVMTNILGVQTLLDAARLNGSSRFIQVSTDEVYGSLDSDSWSEESPLLPNSPYSASKASADLICRSYYVTHKFDVVVTRCSNNYGPYQFPEKLIPRFVTNLIDDLKVPIYGNGLNVRDWLHVDDHCLGIELASEKGRAGEVYNIGGGTELSNLQLTKKILSKLGKDEGYIQYVEDRLGHDFRYSVDISKVEKELGFSPRVNWETGIESTINWYLENQSWWRKLKK